VQVQRAGDRALKVIGAVDSADLNEALVGAGVRVREVTPMRRTLESFYMEALRERREPAEPEEGNTGPGDSSLSTHGGGR
jgi:hypothetical protein